MIYMLRFRHPTKDHGENRCSQERKTWVLPKFLMTMDGIGVVAEYNCLECGETMPMGKPLKRERK